MAADASTASSDVGGDWRWLVLCRNKRIISFARCSSLLAGVHFLDVEIRSRCMAHIAALAELAVGLGLGVSQRGRGLMTRGAGGGRGRGRIQFALRVGDGVLADGEHG